MLRTCIGILFLIVLNQFAFEEGWLRKKIPIYVF